MPPNDSTQHSGLDEQDPRFPSGPWFGFYRQGGTQSRQRFTLRFRDGTVHGEGKDPVAPFIVTGTYCTDTGVVHLTKSYDNYRVFYRGTSLPDDGIPGVWTIPYFGGVITDSGEFHIWPDELAMEEVRRLAREEPVPA